jgi:hypothetical protein
LGIKAIERIFGAMNMGYPEVRFRNEGIGKKVVINGMAADDLCLARVNDKLVACQVDNLN